MDSEGTGFSRFPSGGAVRRRCSKLHLTPHYYLFRRPHAYVPSRPVPFRSVPVPSRPVRPNPGLARLKDNPTKSCTSKAAQGGLDLDPIQSFDRTALGGSGLPGENGRRYSNAGARRAPAPVPTRTLRALLSPEARSRLPRPAGDVQRAAGGGVRGGGVPPGHAPRACPGGTPPPLPHHRLPAVRHRPVWASGNGPLGSGWRGVPRAEGREAGKQGSREAGLGSRDAGKQGSREAG